MARLQSFFIPVPGVHSSANQGQAGLEARPGRIPRHTIGQSFIMVTEFSSLIITYNVKKAHGLIEKNLEAVCDGGITLERSHGCSKPRSSQCERLTLIQIGGLLAGLRIALALGSPPR
ncbi:Uncharacterized protein DAT39_006952 [Clarias magur]|uniref:Uncharacterized protein n=1 Tax=Clarias magur TaxID=1594786 RepID=A0A8J4UKK5_CLAMG|nr:Uncharacterized protein DAT39_006952 [Clarias magur]